MGSILSWAGLLAWLVAIACVALGWRKRRTIEQLRAAAPPRLLAELTGEGAEPEQLEDGARRMAIAELNQRLADVSFELDVLPATFAALTRISLASGAGLTLVSAMTESGEGPFMHVFRMGVAASGGVAGALAVAGIGRAAKSRSTQIREEWDGSSRVVGKALGTSLAASGRIRGNSFPD